VFISKVTGALKRAKCAAANRLTRHFRLNISLRGQQIKKNEQNE
jgi:hypothetical protein